MLIQRKLILGLGVVFFAGLAIAEPIPITYSLTGMGTVVGSTPTTLTLVGHFSGSVLSGDPGLNAGWNPVSYSDQSVADLTTGLLNGNFSIVFANGDTLSGNVFEDVSAIIASPSGTGPFSQSLTFTAGTGEFAAATGSASGNGFVGTTVGTVSGSGSLDAPAIPEPAPLALVVIGIAVILVWRKQTRYAVRIGTLGLTLALGLVLTAAAASADPIAYVLTGSQQFGQMDLATGSFSPIRPIPPTIQYLAHAPDGSLLTMSFDGNLDSMNPRTGTTSVIGPTGFANCSTPSTPYASNCQLSFGATGVTLYATDFANNLYTINPATGKATLVGATGIPAVPFVPASTNPDGSFNFYDENLFGLDGKLYGNFDAGTFNPATSAFTTVISPALYQIDASTGQATRIASTDFGLITASNLDGEVYGFDGVTGQIVTLDLTNGTTTFVSNIDPSAGLIEGAALATPEPAPLALAGFGMAVALICRRRTRKAPVSPQN